MSDQPTKLTPEQEIALKAIVQMMLCDDEFKTDMAGGIHVRTIYCVWCGHSMTSMEEVRAHDVECPKHPLMERIAALEALTSRLKSIIRRLLKDRARCREIASRDGGEYADSPRRMVMPCGGGLHNARSQT